jgi:hypothetical protein
VGDLQNIPSENDSQKVLNLSRRQITPEEAFALATNLVNTNEFLSLNLAHNPIGDSGAQALGAVLEKPNSLQHINLMTCDISDLGAIKIANALQQNKSLKELVLWNNRMGDEAAIAFSKAIQTNQCLMSLDLRLNGISAVGQNAIVAALEKNTTIIELYLVCDSSELRQKLENHLERNKQIYLQNKKENIPPNTSLYYYKFKMMITRFSTEISEMDLDEAVFCGKKAKM